MGHELSVHRQYYRLQEDVIEMAKVSKLLIAAEEGKAHAFKGVQLDDINLEGITIFSHGLRVRKLCSSMLICTF